MMPILMTKPPRLADGSVALLYCRARSQSWLRGRDAQAPAPLYFSTTLPLSVRSGGRYTSPPADASLRVGTATARIEAAIETKREQQGGLLLPYRTRALREWRPTRDRLRYPTMRTGGAGCGSPQGDRVCAKPAFQHQPQLLCRRETMNPDALVRAGLAAVRKLEAMATRSITTIGLGQSSPRPSKPTRVNPL